MMRPGFRRRLLAQGETPPQPPVALPELLGEGEHDDGIHQGQREGEELSGEGQDDWDGGHERPGSFNFLLGHVALPNPNHPLWEPEDDHGHGQAEEHQGELPRSDLGAQVLSLAGATLALAVSLPEIHQGEAKRRAVDAQRVCLDVHRHEAPGLKGHGEHANQPAKLPLQLREEPVGDSDGAGGQPDEEKDHQDGAQADAHLLGGVGHIAVARLGHDGHREALGRHAGVEEPVGRLAQQPAQAPAGLGVGSRPERHRERQQQPIGKDQVEDEGVDEGQLAPVSVGEEGDHCRQVASRTQDAEHPENCWSQDSQLPGVKEWVGVTVTY